MYFDSFYFDNLGMLNGLVLVLQFFFRFIKKCMLVK